MHWSIARARLSLPLACLATACPLSCAACLAWLAQSAPPPFKDDIDAENQGEEPRRRTGRRRDDPIIWSFIKNKLILPCLEST
jgi:hypothetical protein